MSKKIYDTPYDNVYITSYDVTKRGHPDLFSKNLCGIIGFNNGNIEWQYFDLHLALKERGKYLDMILQEVYDKINQSELNDLLPTQ